ncbi:hypothetical protein P3T35_000460 [Kitasatospora sp. GP30]|uniref:hypothetical protein n=1 Tax=Kitasatospora sp. GP30 TaxID=3035084 RepID=UPI000C70EC12|nr:hypothetical protein [Kitasatospora sp. GP30]MDH6138483.1 hypothetical protein [Kitasatospora sp. GP30]
MRAGEAAGTARVVFHPAGLDEELRTVVEEVQAGRWMAMRDLLARSGPTSGLRTARTQVLAAVAAGSDVVETWCGEEPQSPDALVMRARVAVERALRASRQHGAWAGVLAAEAREVCWSAVRVSPADPVPWVCLIALAQLDQRLAVREHQAGAPYGSFLPPGPWGLLHEAYQRDPVGREAHVRMLQFWLSRPRPMELVWNFTSWVEGWAPVGSPLHVLPLLAGVEKYRLLQAAGPLRTEDKGQWRLENTVVKRTARAWSYWFEAEPLEPRSANDLNVLAHALWAGARRAEAARVFEAIGPYASRMPWAYVASEPGRAEQEFVQARSQCRKA